MVKEGKCFFSGDSAATGVASAIVLFVFTFCYLFFYQSDIIYIWLHDLSGGRFHYDRTLGAIVISSLLATVWILATRRHRLARGLKSLWTNLLALGLLFSLIVMATDTSDVMHYRARMETCIREGRFGDALEVGKKSLATDSVLTMLRIRALAEENQLGEHLFEYPLAIGNKAQLPDGTDYRLCEYLLNRDLDVFAKEIVKSYDINKPSLPKHYKEALIIYTHTRSNPLLTYHNEVLDADYEDMQNLEKKSPDAERTSRIRDIYGNTYWYYYLSGTVWNK